MGLIAPNCSGRRHTSRLPNGRQRSMSVRCRVQILHDARTAIRWPSGCVREAAGSCCHMSHGILALLLITHLSCPSNSIQNAGNIENSGMMRKKSPTASTSSSGRPASRAALRMPSSEQPQERRLTRGIGCNSTDSGSTLRDEAGSSLSLDDFDATSIRPDRVLAEPMSGADSPERLRLAHSTRTIAAYTLTPAAGLFL